MKKNRFPLFLSIMCLVLLAVVGFTLLLTGCEKKVVVNSLWESKKYPALPGAKESGMAYVIDSNGTPRVVYHTESAWKYATWNVSEWDIQEITKEEYLGYYQASIVLDKMENPHIIYQSTFHKELQYARKGANGWVTEIIEPEGTAACLTLAYQMEPRVTFISRADGYVKYSVRTNTGWDVKPVTYSGIHSDKEEHLNDNWTSLAIDTTENPHIAYMNFHEGELFYIRRVGETWSNPQSLDKGGKFTGLFANMLLDAKNTPQVVFVAPDNGGVKFAQWMSASWDVKVIDDRGGIIPFMSRTTTGQPCAAYFGPDYKELRYSMGSVWSPEIVEDRRAYAKPKTAPVRPYMTFDNRGRAHIMYYDYQRKQLYEFYKM